MRGQGVRSGGEAGSGRGVRWGVEVGFGGIHNTCTCRDSRYSMLQVILKCKVWLSQKYTVHSSRSIVY